MALKTFNLDEEVYRKFSEHCKKEGISMSKKVDNFLRAELGRISGSGKEELKVKKDEEHSFSKYCH